LAHPKRLAYKSIFSNNDDDDDDKIQLKLNEIILNNTSIQKNIFDIS